MEKLTQITEGEYVLNKQPVNPILVYGPVLHKYEEGNETTIDDLVQQIQKQTGFPLEQRANSYSSGGITIRLGDKRIKHDIFMFFNSKLKPMN